MDIGTLRVNGKSGWLEILTKMQSLEYGNTQGLHGIRNLPISTLYSFIDSTVNQVVACTYHG